MSSSKGRRRRSVCPVACTLDLLGDRWTLLVLRDLLSGKSTFKELSGSPEGIATNILSDRLQRLLDHGLVDWTPSAEHAGRGTYALTVKGHSVRPLLQSIADWGLANIAGTEVRLQLPRRTRRRHRER